MMIHVFYVNRGDMLMFDMSHAVESVIKLQHVISSETGIPVESQVLLISGGEPMSPNSRVCTYSAGTDTCPIFLFNLRAIEEKNPPEITQETDEDGMKYRIEGSINMAPTLATLSTRTQLALDLRDLSRRHEALCKTLVHHQHLQHQGWSTVVANLEDTLQAFIEQADKFSSWYSTFLDKKQDYMDMLQGFPESYNILSKTPLLTSLTDILSGSLYCGRFSPHHSPTTLIQFLTALEEENKDLLEEASLTHNELQQLNDDLLGRMLTERDKVLQAADNSSMKEVKGLENRLYNLEQLIVNASKIVKDQEAYSQSFVHNQNRCRQLADPNILPDLCASHREQLRVMENNDQSLRDIVLRCTDAKRELSANLHTRLRWIMWVEKVVASVDGKITLQYESCRRLKIRIDKLDQIYRAPSVYARLCVEVCRRRNFTIDYKNWSQLTYEKSSEWHHREVEHRREFYKSIGPHFLKTLFPGLDKLPPAIMMSTVRGLDEELPSVSSAEINSMRERLPELEHWLRLPEMSGQLSVHSSLSPRSVRTAVQSQETSDIAVLSPRTNQSSPGAEDVIDPSIEVISLPSNIPGNYAEAMDESDQSVHRMARFSESHDNKFSQSDEEISAVTDDDQAPASLTEDHSGGFMTANFFLSDELESLNRPQQDGTMAETITMQNSQIEKLMADNYSYKNRCDSLTRLVRLLKSSVDLELCELKNSGRSVQQDLNGFQTNMLTLHQQLIDKVPELQQAGTRREVSLTQQSLSNEMEQVKVLLSEKENDNMRLTQLVGDSQTENKELTLAVDKLRADYDQLVSDCEKQSANQRAELEEAETSLRKQLTLEHELELDEVRQTLNDRIESKERELTTYQAEIDSLRTDISELQLQIQTQSTEHERATLTLTAQLNKQHEDQMVELSHTHQQELEQLGKESEQKIVVEVSSALENQRIELESEYQQKLEAMQRSTEDASCNTDEDYMREELSSLRAELEKDKQTAVEQTITDWQAKLTSELETQGRQFQDQMDQNEQELEYRAATMKDSLQAVNEVRFNEKISQMKKEKDSVIAELRRQLNSCLADQHRPPAVLARSVADPESGEMSASVMSQSVVPASPRDAQLLEEQLTERDNMINNLQAKVNSFEMSASSRELINTDKVTVKSCSKGDKVILCYDERYEHYVVFSLSATLHFVHTDSLKVLDLTPPTTGGTRRKPWVLAEIIDKEYCQARKANNRFKVPVNTKFYRVKAKPWTVV